MREDKNARTVKVEQYTEFNIPDGVVDAGEEFMGLFYMDKQDNTVYKLFKLPKPGAGDKELANRLGVPYAFNWIELGDYVVSYSDGYKEVIPMEIFNRKEILKTK
jgi:hypothetical protein